MAVQTNMRMTNRSVRLGALTKNIIVSGRIILSGKFNSEVANIFSRYQFKNIVLTILKRN